MHANASVVSSSSNSLVGLLVNWTYTYVLPCVSTLGFCLELTSIVLFTRIIHNRTSTHNSNNNNNNNHHSNNTPPVTSNPHAQKSHGSLAGNIYKYLLAYSLSDAVSLLIVSFIGLVKCGHTLAIKQYELYVYLYLNAAFNTLSELIDLKIAFSRYSNLFQTRAIVSTAMPSSRRHTIVSATIRSVFNGSDGTWRGICGHLNCAASLMTVANCATVLILCLFVVVSLFFNLPYLFYFEIEAVAATATAIANSSAFVYTADSLNSTANGSSETIERTNEVYKVVENKSGDRHLFWLILIVKDVVLLVLVFSVNMLLAIKFRHKMSIMRRQRLASSITTTSKNTPNHMKIFDDTQMAAAEKELLQPTRVSLEQHRMSTATNLSLVTATLLEKRRNQQYEPTMMKKFRGGDASMQSSTSIHDVERRVTLMILYLCIIFTLGHTPELVYKIVLALSVTNDTSTVHNHEGILNVIENVDDAKFNYLSLFQTVADLMSFATRGLNFFIYYRYNHLFRITFRRTFHALLPSARTINQ